MVVFEDVRFAKSLAQVQLWSSFSGALWALFANYASIAAVPTGELKKFATGMGDADKTDMRAAAVRRWANGVVENWDDNAVDAWWLRQIALAYKFRPNHGFAGYDVRAVLEFPSKA